MKLAKRRSLEWRGTETLKLNPSHVLC